ncbi:hypothetical protein ACFGVR_15345 [Mucilaginibacter sp. AW1-3]
MKKIFLATIVAMATYGQSSAQTNKLEPTGDVGIGTTTPGSLLHVSGGARNGLRIDGALNGTSTSKYLSIWQGAGGIGIDPIGTGQIYLGYDQPSDIFFGGSSPKGIWNLNGNVGIGTTTPFDRLEVSDGWISVLNNLSVGGAEGNGLRLFGNLGNRNYRAISFTPFVPAGSLGVDYVGLKVFTSNGGTNVVNALTILPEGNLGINTDTPASLFQVDDGVSKASIGSAGDSQVLNWGTSYLGFNASRIGSAPNFSWLTNGDTHNNGGGVIYSSVLGDMYFATVPTTGATGQTLLDADIAGHIALKIDHTNGAVYAKQMYVQLTGFPDYVFKKDYKLMSLAQVKSYIDRNHHLPDMPAASVVEKDGINLGEMNKVLTKKVEELTLYLIEKDKEIKEFKVAENERIKKLEKRLAELEKQ